MLGGGRGAVRCWVADVVCGVGRPTWCAMLGGGHSVRCWMAGMVCGVGRRSGVQCWVADVVGLVSVGSLMAGIIRGRKA